MNRFQVIWPLVLLASIVISATQLPLSWQDSSNIFHDDNNIQLIALPSESQHNSDAIGSHYTHQSATNDDDADYDTVSRRQTVSDKMSEEENDPSGTVEVDHLTTTDWRRLRKRLMGLFRCSGWGPGCTSSSGWGSSSADAGYRQWNGRSPSEKQSTQAPSRRRKTQRSSDQQLLQTIQPPVSGASSVVSQAAGSSNRRQPFSRQTSGGSWGPGGRKRSGVCDN